MAFDGIITMAVAHELSEKITLGKIEKVYQPESDELVFNIHTKQGNVKLYPEFCALHYDVRFVAAPAPSPEEKTFLLNQRKISAE